MPDAGDQQRPAVCGGVGCGWTRAFGAALAAEGARGTGKADQAGVVGALRASRAAARAAGQRLPGGCWGGFGCGGSWAADCERSAELGANNGESGSRWGKRIRKRCGGSSARRERPTVAVWKGRRTWEAARTDGHSLHYDNPPVDWYTLTRWVWEERMEQVREIDGEQAYEKMRRAVERASQPLAPSQFLSREGPERGGPERDYGPSR